MQPPIASQFLESILQPSSRDLTKNIGVQGFDVPEPHPQRKKKPTPHNFLLLQYCNKGNKPEVCSGISNDFPTVYCCIYPYHTL